MTKNRHYFAILCVTTFLFMACESKTTYETCVAQSTCGVPPLPENANEALKKLNAAVAGKWKLASYEAENTFLKTSNKPLNVRQSMCVSFNGDVLFYRNNQELVCQYCYQLESAGDSTVIKVDETGLSAYCKEMLQTSSIVVRNDSMLLFRRDSIIDKKLTYKRTNNDWTYKAN
ncbi:MAG: hypothetical protein HC817_14010 [Saprospiraceae bacterium]|nr:hypothetical protein [Saprospiraceae bacterium]